MAAHIKCPFSRFLATPYSLLPPRRSEKLVIPLKYIEYEVHGDLVIIYPKLYSIYLRGTIRIEGLTVKAKFFV